MMNILESPQSYNVPACLHLNFPPALVGIINDYLEEPLPSPKGYNSPCKRILDTFYDTKLRYYSILELHRVMCGKMPDKPPQSFIDAETAMRTMRLQAEQCADWAVIRSFRDYCFKIGGREGESRVIDNAKWCVCRHVSSHVSRIGPMITQIERFMEGIIGPRYFPPTQCYCQLSLQHNGQVDLSDPLYQVRLSSLNHLENSIRLANEQANEEQHSQDLPLSRSQHLKQRIIFCAKFALSLVVIGCMVLNTAFKIVSMSITCAILLNIDVADKVGRGWYCCIFLGIILTTIRVPLGLSLAVGTALSIYCHIPYIRHLWKARKPIFQLHMECLPACHRLWKDYTQRLGVLKGSYHLLSDVLWRRSINPSVERLSVRA